jgi:hypothetical protein
MIIIYRAVLNVFREYKKLLQVNLKTYIYETCKDRKKKEKIFSIKLFFILVYISAAKQ